MIPRSELLTWFFRECDLLLMNDFQAYLALKLFLTIIESQGYFYSQNSMALDPAESNSGPIWSIINME